MFFLLQLPFVDFVGVGQLDLFLLGLLIALGYLSISSFGNSDSKEIVEYVKKSQLTRCINVTIFFAFLSILGCQLIIFDRNESFVDIFLNATQERYISIIEASSKGLESSLLSTFGNLFRSFVFIVISSATIAGKNIRSSFLRYLLYALIIFIIYQNYMINVSRVQLIFYLIFWIVSFRLSSNLFFRITPLFIFMILIISIFLVLSTSQRLELMYGNVFSISNHMLGYFGVNMLPIGSIVFDFLSPPFLVLYLYLIQPLPELVRLISLNDSPYLLGMHSFYLLAAPFLRIFGIHIPVIEMTNQGMWWGLMGDLYIDFGYFFPFSYVFTLFMMVWIAKRYGGGPIFGFSLRVMTVSIILISPFIGPFNTFSVSYIGVLALAVFESALKSKISFK